MYLDSVICSAQINVNLANFYIQYTWVWSYIEHKMLLVWQVAKPINCAQANMSVASCQT
jgi:hypothetical protein